MTARFRSSKPPASSHHCRWFAVARSRPTTSRRSGNLKERLEGFTTTSEGPGGSRRASHVWPPFVVRSNNAEVPLALAPVTNANPSLLLGKVSDVTDQWPMKLIELADAEN